MLIKLINFTKKIYHEKPKLKKKKGKPKEYSDFQIILIFLIMPFKGISSYKGIVEYLIDNPKVCQAIGLKKIPCRTTLLRRAETIHKKFREVIQSIGRYYCNFYISMRLLGSIDSSGFESKGGLWHKKYRKLGILPDGLRNIDRDSKWGKSSTKDWFQGYKGHFIVVYDLERNMWPFPVDAVVTTANITDDKKTITLCNKLIKKIIVILGDKGYHAVDLFLKLLEKGRFLITPIKKGEKLNKNNRLQWFLYCLYRVSRYKYTRNITIEPFNGRFKDCFNLDPLPVKGKKNVNVAILSSILAYQIIELFNLESNRKMGEVKRVLNSI